MTARPRIGVFDSGFGGLTVLRELLRTLPGADFVYLGDTARLPYGSKSAETITRYTVSAIHALRERGAELVVIACNTASALALPALRAQGETELVGVIEPGAQAATQAVKDDGCRRRVLVLATEATVASHAYAAACAERGLLAQEKACPLLVPLVEEGWIDHPVTSQVAEIYLMEAARERRAHTHDEALAHDLAARSGLDGAMDLPSAILLGCTHYPLLRDLLRETARHVLGDIPIVDSAEATAAFVATLQPSAALPNAGTPDVRFLATDSVEKFKRLGARFLDREIEHVEHIDLNA